MARTATGEGPGLAMKIGIAGVLAIGAVASGYFLSRPGRRMLREAIEGRRRTRLEDRVLEALWSDRALARRPIDVEEAAGATIVLTGAVRSEEERSRALAITTGTKEVASVEDRLTIDPAARRRFRTPQRA